MISITRCAEDNACQSQPQPRALGTSLSIVARAPPGDRQPHNRSVKRQHSPPVSLEKQVYDETESARTGQNTPNARHLRHAGIHVATSNANVSGALLASKKRINASRSGVSGVTILKHDFNRHSPNLC